MNQQERFEAFYADQHGVEIATMTQYRMGDSYRLPGIAGHYRTFKAAEDGISKIAELAAKKLRSAEICHPRAVDTLIGEARELLAGYLPEGWPESAMSKEAL